MNLNEEFERQINNLLSKKYYEAANLSEEKFAELLQPLKKYIAEVQPTKVDIEKGTLPFVIVIKDELVPTGVAMNKVKLENKEGITKLFPHEPKDFQIIQSEQIPESPAYLLVDIDRGKEILNITPYEALQTIRGQNRLPLTIDEGVAIVTQFPEFLIKNNCFSLLASRNPKDKRVPAIWINGQKHPNLGWCWDSNQHTWLGSASAKKRIA